jgi:hypothetical protein
MIPSIKYDQIKRQFEKETGISQDRIEEILEAFPTSYYATINTMDRTFHFKLTYTARAKKGSFYEEKQP